MSFSPVSAVYDMLANEAFNDDCVSAFTPAGDCTTPIKSSIKSVPDLTPTSDDFQSDAGPLTPGGDPLFDGWLSGVEEDAHLAFAVDSCSDEEEDHFSIGKSSEGKVLDEKLLDSLVLDCTPIPTLSTSPSMSNVWGAPPMESLTSPVENTWVQPAPVGQSQHPAISYGSMDDMFLDSSMHSSVMQSFGSAAQHLLQPSSVNMQKSWSQPQNPLQEILAQPMHQSHPLAFMRPEQVSMLSNVASSAYESAVAAQAAVSTPAIAKAAAYQTSASVPRSAVVTPPNCLHVPLPNVPPLDKDDLEASIRRRSSDETLAQSHARVRKQLAQATRLVGLHHQSQLMQSPGGLTINVAKPEPRRMPANVDRSLVINSSYVNQYSPPPNSASSAGTVYQAPFAHYSSYFPESIPTSQSPRPIRRLPNCTSPAPCSPLSPAISFVNFTSADAQRLSSAVAPSGSGKRKQRELEMQRQEKRARTSQQ